MKHTLSPTATLYHADCREALRLLPDNSIDSVVTDPPYALVSMNKRLGNTTAEEVEKNFTKKIPGQGKNPYGTIARGFMGKTWDTGETAFSTEFWQEVFRVLKPGGHVAAFGASRGYHRMAVAIEDAGFEIRDSLMWLYGTGFPKSQDVSKFIDKALGAEREILGQRTDGRYANPMAVSGRSAGIMGDVVEREAPSITRPVTPAAIEFDGFGTALKPSFEPIVLARKPLSEPTVAANVLRWRTGALNIGGCRIEAPDGVPLFHKDNKRAGNTFDVGSNRTGETSTQGRWPANVVHDGSEEVVGAFPNTAPAKAGNRGLQHSGRHGGLADIGGNIKEGTNTVRGHSDDGGSAARFFYSAKASKADRNGSKHPTVKPISLMEWLATLITPPGGTILDPFAGSGTTGKAAQNKGFSVILCEREAEYIADIMGRFDHAPAEPIAAPSPLESPSSVAFSIDPDRLREFHKWNAAARSLQSALTVGA